MDKKIINLIIINPLMSYILSEGSAQRQIISGFFSKLKIGFSFSLNTKSEMI